MIVTLPLPDGGFTEIDSGSVIAVRTLGPTWTLLYRGPARLDPANVIVALDAAAVLATLAGRPLARRALPVASVPPTPAPAPVEMEDPACGS